MPAMIVILQWLTQPRFLLQAISLGFTVIRIEYRVRYMAAQQ